MLHPSPRTRCPGGGPVEAMGLLGPGSATQSRLMHPADVIRTVPFPLCSNSGELCPESLPNVHLAFFPIHYVHLSRKSLGTRSAQRVTSWKHDVLYPELRAGRQLEGGDTCGRSLINCNTRARRGCSLTGFLEHHCRSQPRCQVDGHVGGNIVSILVYRSCGYVPPPDSCSRHFKA